MKYFLAGLCLISIILIIIFVPLGSSEKQVEYLRIHIRANSNEQVDQEVKYKVKDEIVDALIPLLSDVDSFEKATKVIENNFDYIESVANSVLEKEGLSYKSSAQIKNEYFPTRTYENVTLEEGYYDALIVNLGSGEGNNWWCIVFPAFCFTKTTKTDNIVYISKIWDIIKDIIGG